MLILKQIDPFNDSQHTNKKHNNVKTMMLENEANDNHKSSTVKFVITLILFIFIVFFIIGIILILT